jgi:hypothetical protein
MQRKKSLLAGLKLDCNGKLPPPYMAVCGRWLAVCGLFFHAFAAQRILNK